MDRFLLGSWNVICDRCHKKLKAEALKREWTGFMVCDGCWEPRHPQDLIKPIGESPPLPYTRPEKADEFIGPTYISESIGTQETTIPAGTFNMSIS